MRRKVQPVAKPVSAPLGGFCFQSAELAKPVKCAAPKVKPVRARSDPRYHKATRELRDRYLERFNADGHLVLPTAQGKYDVSQTVAAPRPARC